MAERFVLPVETALDSNGDPLSGAKLYFYLTNSSTPADTYSDSDLTVPNTNPVVADSAGRFGSIFLETAVTYKVILKDSSDVTIWTRDPVAAPASVAEASQSEVDARTSTTKFVSPAKIADGVGLQGASIASAATLTLPTVGDYFNVTGSTSITAISTRTAGREITLVFAAALTLTHNATSLILPGGANITTAAGDSARLRSEGSGNWRCVGYTKANGGSTAYATQAQMQSETAGKAVSADNLKYHPGVAKVSVAFHWDGSAIVLDEGYGVTNAASITRNAAGDYTINFNVTFANTKFRVGGSFDLAASNTATGFSIRARTTTSVRVQLGWGTTFAAGDPPIVSVNVYGTLA